MGKEKRVILMTFKFTKWDSNNCPSVGEICLVNDTPKLEVLSVEQNRDWLRSKEMNDFFYKYLREQHEMLGRSLLGMYMDERDKLKSGVPFKGRVIRD
jgi:hypothetical protein